MAVVLGGQWLGFSNERQLQRLAVKVASEAAPEMGATAILFPLKWPLPLATVDVGAHL